MVIPLESLKKTVKETVKTRETPGEEEKNTLKELFVSHMLVTVNFSFLSNVFKLTIRITF